ncbi:MAG: hypothetical protein Q4E09_00835 [Eubacteriales bacterium]|nr:hypothetical protein [Eubacteriales bacterium]
MNNTPRSLISNHGHERQASGMHNSWPQALSDLRTQGNLAYETVAWPPQEVPDYQEAYERQRALAKREADRQRQLAEAQKRLALERRQKIRRVLGCLVIVSLVFGGLMTRQAKIYEQNFSNTAMRRQIEEQKEDNSELQNRLLSKSENSYIEKEALRLFGLRRPSQMQRVVVDLPPSDNLIFYEHKGTKTDSEQSISNNYQVLEAYMKAFGIAPDDR